MDPKVIGVIVGMLLCVSSSVSSAMSTGGNGDDSGEGGAEAEAGGGSTPTHSTPLEGKIYHTSHLIGWVDPGHTGVEGHISGTSIKDCFDKAPEGAVIAGWRSGKYADTPYQNTCFYYDRSQSGEPKQVVAEHTVACMDSTKDVNQGCGVPRVTGTIYGTGADVGWSDPGPRPGGHLSTSLEGCVSKAPSEAVIVGHRDGAYADTPYQNTCFYYTKAQSGPPTQQQVGNHHLTCKDPSKSISTGCA
jgi:hypothetical protein